MKRQIEIKREFDKPPGEWDFKTQCFQKLTDPVDREFYEQHCKYVAVCLFVYLQVLVPLYHARSLPHPLDFLN